MSNPWERNTSKNDKPERNTMVDLISPITPEVPVIDHRYIEASPWYLSTVVDSTYNPKDSLLTHISGSRWSCTYYQQIRDKDEGLDSKSSSNGIYQQYRKIERFELRVDSELTPTQDEHSEMVTSGSSKIFTSLIPNVGDVFVADVNDGRLAEFSVTSVKRMTLAKNTCYQIEYSLIDFILDNTRLQDLEDKVFQTFVFSIDYLQAGMSPFLTEEETVTVEHLKLELKELGDSYLSEFYNQQLNTIIYPTQTTRDNGIQYLYDGFLTEFVKKIFEGAEELKSYLVSSNNSTYDRDTIWDLILERRNTRRPTMVSKVKWFSGEYQYSQPHLNLLHWSAISYYTYPSSDVGGNCISESEENNQLGVSSPLPSWNYNYGESNGDYSSGFLGMDLMVKVPSTVVDGLLSFDTRMEAFYDSLGKSKFSIPGIDLSDGVTWVSLNGHNLIPGVGFIFEDGGITLINSNGSPQPLKYNHDNLSLVNYQYPETNVAYRLKVNREIFKDCAGISSFDISSLNYKPNSPVQVDLNTLTLTQDVDFKISGEVLTLLDGTSEEMEFPLENNSDVLVVRVVSVENSEVVTEKPAIFPNEYNQHYILSSFWYSKNQTNYTTLESVLDDYLNNTYPDTNKLKLILDSRLQWSKLDRFLLTPILYALLKITVVTP